MYKDSEALERRRRVALARMVKFARARSPLYRDLYRGLPRTVSDSTRLPITSKKTLMPEFDRWITDRSVTLAQVREFIGKTTNIGTQFKGKYLAATTSGSTGTPGIFLLDRYNHRAVSAWGTRSLLDWLSPFDLIRLALRGGRMVTIAATGAHFVVATTTTAIANARFGPSVKLLDAALPMHDLVAQLNAYRPGILSGYAGLISLLAKEQEVGRLRIRPLLAMPGSEALGVGEDLRIANAFHAKVGLTYVATECLGMASSCSHGWLHLNSPFAIVEPVDANFQPVPPGVQSHTTLVTNLANRIQPIIRYDLSDSILVRPEPCECGSTLPAIRVQGRTADLLHFANERGEDVVIAPLVLQTAVDRLPGVERFQIVQAAPATLRVRLLYRDGHDRETVWTSVEGGILSLLRSRGVTNVQIVRATEPPEQVPGRKFRTVIPLGKLEQVST